MISAAASYLPSEDREDAIRTTVLTAAGYNTKEIASQLGLRSKDVVDLRQRMGTGLVSLFKAQGYTDSEIVTTLGISATVMAGRYSTDG